MEYSVQHRIANTGNGADGMINKGFRYYEAEVADGVYVDFYILHMDADSDQGISTPGMLS